MSAAVTSYKNRAYKNSIKSAAKSELLQGLAGVHAEEESG